MKKPLDDFYKHPKMGDGHLGKCKECAKKDTMENKLRNYEYYRKYDIERSNTPRRIELRKETTERYRHEYPDKINACQKARRARIKGLITPPNSCPSCGYGGKLIMHHPDYSKPLEVEWMCQRCHKRLHAQLNVMGVTL